MYSCDILLSISVLDFEDLSLNAWEVDLNTDFFRRVNFDSNEDWNDELNGGWEDNIEISELGRMSSVSEGKTFETHKDLGFEVEGTYETSHSSSDEMMCLKEEEETCSEWREGMMICSSCKTLWKFKKLSSKIRK